MSRSKQTVEYLAKQANTDPDEALLRLWDGGIEYVKSSGTKIRRGDVDQARRILGLLGRDELPLPEAWQKLLGMTKDEFEELDDSEGLEYTNSGRLKGKSIRKLEAYARDRGQIAPGPVTLEVNSNGRTNPDSDALHGNVEVSPLVWKTIGRERPIRHLAYEDVIAIHEEVVDYFRGHHDPIEPAGVRDENLLASAIERPRTSLGDELKYPTIEMAAAGLLHSLIHDHPFHNGNKRTALVSMLAFLDTNRFAFTGNEDETFRQILKVAEHAVVPKGADKLSDREALEVARWLSRNTRQIELGDRPVPFRKLRRLLVRYDCEFTTASNSQMTILRSIRRKGFFGRVNTQNLSCQISYGGEGREVGRGVMATIRRDLQIDENHGIDSAAFYDNAPAVAGEFIILFSKTLRRLSRM